MSVITYLGKLKTTDIKASPVMPDEETGNPCLHDTPTATRQLRLLLMPTRYGLDSQPNLCPDSLFYVTFFMRGVEGGWVCVCVCVRLCARAQCLCLCVLCVSVFVYVYVCACMTIKLCRLSSLLSMEL